jgi:hypothetical protein
VAAWATLLRNAPNSALPFISATLLPQTLVALIGSATKSKTPVSKRRERRIVEEVPLNKTGWFPLPPFNTCFRPADTPRRRTSRHGTKSQRDPFTCPEAQSRTCGLDADEWCCLYIPRVPEGHLDATIEGAGESLLAQSGGRLSGAIRALRLGW